MKIAARRFLGRGLPRWLGVTAAFTVAAWAAERPVRITAPETVPVAADGTARVRLTLEIAGPYHVFGTVPSAGGNGPGPNPTTVASGRGAPFALAGPVETSPPRKFFDPNFGADVLVVALGFDGHARDPIGVLKLDSGDFGVIGTRVRALVVDKDRKPNWKPARVEDVDPATIAAVFA